MTVRGNTTPQEAASLRGDLQPLLGQVGAPGGVAGFGALLALGCRGRIETPEALSRFLIEYRDQLLLPVELPAVIRAYQYATQGHWKDLVELDRSLASMGALRPFSAASIRVGQRQLNRLRPLRDHRLLKRYREAIERGEAHGWHSVVFGVSLAVFSLPLRQGLAAYSHNTLAAFLQEGGRPLGLSAAQMEDLDHEVSLPLREALRRLLPAGL